MIRNCITVIAFAAVLAGCNAQTSPTVKTAALPDSELRDLTEAEKKQLGPFLAATLKDPESAKFTWTKVPRQMPATFSYCAMVNAKNSYGGYIGMQPFIAAIQTKNNKIQLGGIGAVASSQAGDAKIIENLCAAEGLDPYRV
jgi:hypothetical protein